MEANFYRCLSGVHSLRMDLRMGVNVESILYFSSLSCVGRRRRSLLSAEFVGWLVSGYRYCRVFG